MNINRSYWLFLDTGPLESLHTTLLISLTFDIIIIISRSQTEAILRSVVQLLTTVSIRIQWLSVKKPKKRVAQNAFFPGYICDG